MNDQWSRRSFVTVAGAMMIPRWSARRWDDEIDEYVRSVMRTRFIPGAAISLLEKGRVQWARGYGFANLERQVPMTPETILNVGSVTKTVTATAIMQLWEQGRLDLDADLNTVLPFPVRNPAHPTQPITVRHLLTHTSSIHDGPDYERSYVCGDPAHPLNEWVREYVTQTKAPSPDERHFTDATPGAAWEYSNVGFGLLGVVIETIAKQRYADYTTEHIFEPLGMTSTGWYLDRIDRARHATPYQHVASGPAQVEMLQDPSWVPSAHPAPTFVPYCLYSFPTLPDGLMRTTAVDLSRFVAAYQSEGALGSARILRPATVRAMLSPQPVTLPASGGHGKQGLAWYQTGTPPMWQHGGADPGISALVCLNPNGRAVVVICNALSQGSAEIGHHLAQ